MPCVDRSFAVSKYLHKVLAIGTGAVSVEV